MAYEDLSIVLITLRKKFIIFALILIFGIFVSFPFTGRLINNINNNVLPEGASVIFLSPLEVMLLKMKIALIIGVLLIIPVVLYYIYSAIKKRTNRKISISSSSIFLICLAAIVFFLLGAGYAYYLMLPLFINFLYQNAASSGVVATYSIAEFISFVALTTVIFGLVFEFPLFIIILVRSGLVERDLLVHYRFHVYIGLLILSALITPPDVFSQIIIAVPLIMLFEISLVIVRFVGKPVR
ncbi:MAG: twin-arginine translocase subunit TatC [Methanosarcinales archaeon]